MGKVIERLKSKKWLVLLVAALMLSLLGFYVLKRTESSSATQTTTAVTRTETEQKLCNLLESIQGVGQTEVYVNEEDNVVLGVVVVCEGADNIWVKNDILNVVSTALNINKSLIAIYAIKI